MVRRLWLLFVPNERPIALQEEVSGSPGLDVFPWKASLWLIYTFPYTSTSFCLRSLSPVP